MLKRIFARWGNPLKFPTHPEEITPMPMIRFCEAGACGDHADVIAQVQGWRTAFDVRPMAVCNGCIPKLASEGHTVLLDEPAEKGSRR